MTIDCIADLHGHYPELEGGDLLIVAGDLTARDDLDGYLQFNAWIGRQNYACKIVIAGNHDNKLQENKYEKFIEKWDDMECEYLCDSGTEFEGLKIWGSPWTQTFEGMNPHCKAFTVDTDEELAEKWAMIPDDTDILITHCPPLGVRDGRPLTREEQCKNISPVDVGFGSSSLHDKIHEIAIKKENPLIHIFGHIHEGYGRIDLCDRALDRRILFCINASHVNERYEPVNKPIRIEL